MRLACQIRPTEPLTVVRLLRPEAAGAAWPAGSRRPACVRVAAVLFVDIRGFTRLSETKLAFDVVYILNAFFAEAGRAVEAGGGRVDKYIGDGLMAVFEHADGLRRRRAQRAERRRRHRRGAANGQPPARPARSTRRSASRWACTAAGWSAAASAMARRRIRR